MEEKIKRMIEENVIALATINEDGTPNVIPVKYAKVISKNELIITDNFMIKTRKNILANEDICLAIWDKNENGIKIVGKARYFDSGKWKDYIKNLQENQGLSAKGAIIINIQTIKSLAG